MFGNFVWMVIEFTNPKPLSTPKVVSMEFYAVNGEGHGGNNKKISSVAVTEVLRYPMWQRGIKDFDSYLHPKMVHKFAIGCLLQNRSEVLFTSNQVVG
jgi:hypothetical protein